MFLSYRLYLTLELIYPIYSAHKKLSAARNWKYGESLSGVVTHIKRGTYVCTENAECGRLIIHMKSSYYSLFPLSFSRFFYYFFATSYVVKPSLICYLWKKNSLNERTIFHVLWNFYFKRWIFQTFTSSILLSLFLTLCEIVCVCACEESIEKVIEY